MRKVQTTVEIPRPDTRIETGAHLVRLAVEKAIGEVNARIKQQGYGEPQHYILTLAAHVPEKGLPHA